MTKAARRSAADWLLVLLFWGAGLAALLFPLAYPESGGLFTLSDGTGLFSAGVCAVLCWLVLERWLRLSEPFAGGAFWALAAILATVQVFSQSYAAVHTGELVRRFPLRTLALILGRVPLYRGAMALLLKGLSGVSRPFPRRLSSLGLGGGLLLCWLPWLYFIFPGTVSNDSVTQVMEIIGVEPLSNANPIFQTGLVYLFRGAGVVLGSADAGVALYCGLQAALMAWLLGGLLSQMAGDGTPRWLFWLSFGFYAFLPVFPLFAFCMGKDTNFSMAVLWLMLLCQKLLVGKPADKKIVFCLCLAAVLCTLLRNPGFYLSALTLGLLLGYSLRRKGSRLSWKAPALALCGCAAAYMAVRLLLVPALSIAPTPETENWSLPLQQVARVTATHSLTPQEAQAIDGVLELDKLAQDYNGELSDPVKYLWRENATAEQKKAFFETWLRLLGKYPSTCLSATFHNTYGYLSPGTLSKLKPTLLIGRQKRSTPEVEAAFDYTVNPRANSLKAFMDSLTRFPLYRALIAPGLYGWLCLMGILTLLCSRRKRLLLAAVPAAFSLAGCLLSAVNGYFRYAMPLYLCAPPLLWLCAQALSPAKERKAL